MQPLIWEDEVKIKPIDFANFGWSKAFQNPLNRSETMNILAIKRSERTKNIAQLWVIGKFMNTTLVIYQYLTFTIKLCLTNEDHITLEIMIRKWGKLIKDWDSSIIKLVINFLMR